MTQTDWNLITVALRVTNNYSWEAGEALRKLIHEHGVMLGQLGAQAK